MKILNKEITKTQVKIAIGGIVLAAVGTVAAITMHNKNEEKLIEGIDFVEIDEVGEPIELDSYKEVEA